MELTEKQQEILEKAEYIIEVKAYKATCETAGICYRCGGELIKSYGNHTECPGCNAKEEEKMMLNNETIRYLRAYQELVVNISNIEKNMIISLCKTA